MLWEAISLSVAARPPRVGSRSTWTCGAAERTASTISFNGAQSLSTVVPKLMPSRKERMAVPWSPMVPEMSTASPGRAARPEIVPSEIFSPMPEIAM